MARTEHTPLDESGHMRTPDSTTIIRVVCISITVKRVLAIFCLFDLGFCLFCYHELCPPDICFLPVFLSCNGHPTPCKFEACGMTT